MKIITRYDPTPMPKRDFDWIAYYDEKDDCYVGSGRSEQDAIDDLIEIMGDLR